MDSMSSAFAACHAIPGNVPVQCSPGRSAVQSIVNALICCAHAGHRYKLEILQLERGARLAQQLLLLLGQSLNVRSKLQGGLQVFLAVQQLRLNLWSSQHRKDVPMFACLRRPSTVNAIVCRNAGDATPRTLMPMHRCTFISYSTILALFKDGAAGATQATRKLRK
jgi:hypothetical protein